LVHVVVSTLSVALARQLEKAHVDAGIAHVAAPVMAGLTQRAPAN
jgi:3-hydroxyisobutyrate dehydrogenase-like beta-hydroxyacid dehydrogenase